MCERLQNRCAYILVTETVTIANTKVQSLSMTPLSVSVHLDTLQAIEDNLALLQHTAVDASMPQMVIWLGFLHRDLCFHSKMIHMTAQRAGFMYFDGSRKQHSGSAQDATMVVPLNAPPQIATKLRPHSNVHHS